MLPCILDHSLLAGSASLPAVHQPLLGSQFPCLAWSARNMAFADALEHLLFNASICRGPYTPRLLLPYFSRQLNATHLPSPSLRQPLGPLYISSLHPSPSSVPSPGLSTLSSLARCTAPTLLRLPISAFFHPLGKTTNATHSKEAGREEESYWGEELTRRAWRKWVRDLSALSARARLPSGCPQAALMPRPHPAAPGPPAPPPACC